MFWMGYLGVNLSPFRSSSFLIHATLLSLACLLFLIFLFYLLLKEPIYPLLTYELIFSLFQEVLHIESTSIRCLERVLYRSTCSPHKSFEAILHRKCQQSSQLPALK